MAYHQAGDNLLPKPMITFSDLHITRCNMLYATDNMLLRSRHFLYHKLWHFHRNIRSHVKNECCFPRTVNISNVNFTSTIRTIKQCHLTQNRNNLNIQIYSESEYTTQIIQRRALKYYCNSITYSGISQSTLFTKVIFQDYSWWLQIRLITTWL